MSAETRRGSLPALPQELWDRIIAFAASNDRHASKTWFGLRRVSKRFRTATERAFLEAYLKKVELRFDFGSADFEEWKARLGMDLVYDRLAPQDQSDRAVFKEKTDSPVAAAVPEQEEKKDIAETLITTWWRAQTDSYLGDGGAHSRHDVPPHVIVLRRSPRWQWVNDTDLPDMDVDYEAREVSFRWPGMLSALFAEEDRVNWLRRLAHKGYNKSELDEMRVLLQEGAVGMVDLLGFVSKMILSTTDKCYRMARRERLRAWYKKNGDGFELSKDYFTGDFGEAERLKELKGVRAMLAFEDWDDEDSEGISDAQTRSDDIEEDEGEIDETELEFLFEDEDELDIDDLEHERSRMMEKDYTLWRQRADAESERHPDLGPL